MSYNTFQATRYTSAITPKGGYARLNSTLGLEMAKMVATVYQLPSGSLIPALYCETDTGEILRTVTDTLMEFVQQMPSQLHELVRQAAQAQSLRVVSELPDASINDVNIWFSRPPAKADEVVISNENTEYSSEDGRAQVFTYTQLLSALEHWLEFMAQARDTGLASWVGVKHTAPLPVRL